MKITFFRSALNSEGNAYKSPLMSITVPNSVSETQALAEATKQFQEHMKIAHWQELAEFYEIN